MIGEDNHLEAAYEDRYTTLADYAEEDGYDDEDDTEEEDEEDDHVDSDEYGGFDSGDLAPAGYTGRHRANVL